MSALCYELSYWERESFFRHIDVAIIGSGIVGLSAAIHLKQWAPGRKVVVLERGPLPIGASTRNAGFACFGSLSELLDDLEHHTETSVFQLVERRFLGLQRLRALLGDQAIGYEEFGGYELFRDGEEARFAACADAMADFNRKMKSITGLAETYRLADGAQDRLGIGGANHLILNVAEGQIHTGKMMAALLERARAAGVIIFNGLGIEQIREQENEVELLTSAGWSFPAGAVLVATNGFARKLLPQLDVQPARNQVLITGPVPGLRLRGCFHYDRGYFYFRDVNGRILLGGGRHLDQAGEQTEHFGTTGLIRDSLLQLLQKVVLPDRTVNIDTWWSGILGVGGQKKPIVQRISPKVAVAVRMGGMGVAIGSLVGEEGAGLLRD